MRETRTEKAHRLLVTGRLVVREVVPGGRVRATCDGDTGRYDVVFERGYWVVFVSGARGGVLSSHRAPPSRRSAAEACGVTDWLVPALEELLRCARREQRATDAGEQHAEVRARVADYLADHPDATANAVSRAIGGRRGEVLLAVREARVPVPIAAPVVVLGVVEDRRAFLDALKRTVGCFDCETVNGRLDFDHRDDEIKLFEIANSERRSWPEVLAEIAKCDVRCASCHTRRHNGEAAA